jgi:hypothetical protein
MNDMLAMKVITEFEKLNARFDRLASMIEATMPVPPQAQPEQMPQESQIPAGEHD